MVVKTVYLFKSPRPEKKYRVVLDNGRKVDFGAVGYSDYTIHKDYDRMKLYESRHRKRENWTKSGIGSAGFWSKWILWNKPSLINSIKDTEKKFGIKIIRRKP
jgi:hypothetical protein